MNSQSFPLQILQEDKYSKMWSTFLCKHFFNFKLHDFLLGVQLNMHAIQIEISCMIGTALVDVHGLDC